MISFKITQLLKIKNNNKEKIILSVSNNNKNKLNKIKIKEN